MEKLRLEKLNEKHLGQISGYISEFPEERLKVTFDPDRIPGLDHLECFGSIGEWYAFCLKNTGKISWFVTIRESDGKMIGAVCLRHSLEYDDDEEDFSSHIGYSVRPSERMKGYAKEQLRLCLSEAKRIGLEKVRIVCRDINIGSGKTIRANGGVYLGQHRTTTG